MEPGLTRRFARQKWYRLFCVLLALSLSVMTSLAPVTATVSESHAGHALSHTAPGHAHDSVPMDAGHCHVSGCAFAFLQPASLRDIGLVQTGRVPGHASEQSNYGSRLDPDPPVPRPFA